MKEFAGFFALPPPDAILRVCDTHEDLREKGKGDVVPFDSGVFNTGVDRSLQF